MNIKGVTFGEFHSWRDLSLILTGKTIGKAEAKTESVEIPGADGALDLTEYFGDIYYKTRKLEFSFQSIAPQSDFLQQYSEVQRHIDGKRLKVILDDDPDFYYLGRVSVSDWKSSKGIGEVSITVDAHPFKRKMFETVITETVSQTADFILPNLKERVNPVIATSAQIAVTFEGNVYTVPAGSWTIPEISLKQGKNLLTVTGNATVSFSYREGGL